MEVWLSVKYRALESDYQQINSELELMSLLKDLYFTTSLAQI